MDKNRLDSVKTYTMEHNPITASFYRGFISYLCKHEYVAHSNIRKIRMTTPIEKLVGKL